MSKSFYKTPLAEAQLYLSEMKEFDANVFANRFRVWKWFSGVSRLFSAFMAAKQEDGRYDYEAFRAAYLPPGQRPVYVAHSKNATKAAVLVKTVLAEQYRLECVISGDIYGREEEVLGLLCEQAGVSPQDAAELADTCSGFLKRVGRECLEQCWAFVFIVPDKVKLVDGKLQPRNIKDSPWLAEELCRARSLCLGQEPPADTAGALDLSFLDDTRFPDLLKILKPL